MNTHCKSDSFEIQGPGRRSITADFKGGTLSSEGGALLLREADRIRSITSRLADCFVDARDPRRIEHSVGDLLRQRIYGLVLGHEDLNDHDELRKDPLLATVVGKVDATGANRARERDQGAALAGRSTLNRLEHSLQAEAAESRYHRITADGDAIERFFVDVFLDSYETPPKRIVLDFDATDNRLHGEQEERFFHGYYGHYCYLPLYVFCDRHLLCAKLRPSNIDGAEGSLEVLKDLVEQIRARWPEVEIVVRGDSGFARDYLMTWCESNTVQYVLGLARNKRLQEQLEPTFQELEASFEGADGGAGRLYTDFRYQTLNSWDRERRVIGKAEVTGGGRNPRFVVTSLRDSEVEAQALYEQIYCARGEMENRIKEQQLDLFSSRTSGHLMRVNQMRLWLSGVAYVLFEALRSLALGGTELERARCETIRLKLLKIGARVRVTTRKIWLSLSTAYPHRRLWMSVMERLRQHGPPLPA